MACALTLAVAPASAETLVQALVDAEAANPSLSAERARLQATSEAIAQAFAQGLPSLDAELEAGHADEKSMPGRVHTPRNPANLTVTARVPIFRGFRTINGVREARARVRSGESRLSDAAQSLFAEVAAAFADIRRDRRVARLTTDNLSFHSTELAAIRKRLEGGEQTRTDLAQAEARREEARADLSAVRATLAESEARFSAIVGRVPGKLEAPQIPSALIPPTLDQAIALADARNPAISASREDATVADYQARVRHGEFLPELSLEATYEDDYNPTATTDRTEETTVMARATWQLYQGGAKWSRYREASAQAIAKRYDYAQARVSTAAEVTALYRHRVAATDRIAAARAQVAAARTAVQGVRLEAKVGQRSVIEILDAQRDLVDAQIALADAERDLTVTTFQLLAQLGRCDPQSLGATRTIAPAASAAPAPASTGGLRTAIYE